MHIDPMVALTLSNKILAARISADRLAAKRNVDVHFKIDMFPSLQARTQNVTSMIRVQGIFRRTRLLFDTDYIKNWGFFHFSRNYT